ncbi:thioredoxin domain-containing protein [Isoptericola sp. b441]|uniref:Thioredoxin domain-containing protein n=1 Tax=Actinotalea lenta TaxID=3064654 RepID=A0ABT9D718_9CELL|nr:MULTISPECIES: thioredoxin domain-containing protein [unclassified Isoptericola]MDO8106642.1 thioredoxin domain-containing protein [Isoptericola sp. b441]MDO8121650.1 thioredoxin domain-containing protein [Isoptericola sp. b490]
MAPSSKDRREQAKAAADALRAKQAKAAQRQRTIAIVSLVVGIVVVVSLVLVILNNGTSAAPAAQVTPTVATGHGGIVFDRSGLVTPPDGAGAAAPGASPSSGVTLGPAGLTSDWPQNGDFAGNPVVVSVYFDPMCPYCGHFEQQSGKLLDQLRASGEIVIDSHPLSFLDRSSAGTNYSTRVANAAWTLAEKAPDAYFGFLEGVFADGVQPQEGTAGLTDDQIAQIALSAGAPKDVVDTFTDGTYTWWVAQATDIASQDLGSIATPDVMLNGVSISKTVDIYDPTALKAAIDAAAKG